MLDFVFESRLKSRRHLFAKSAEAGVAESCEEQIGFRSDGARSRKIAKDCHFPKCVSGSELSELNSIGLMTHAAATMAVKLCLASELVSSGDKSSSAHLQLLLAFGPHALHVVTGCNH